jgi:bifunctional NMN adenylyltransferase/nudix hydrolase
MSKKQFDYLVFIGRFQPFHKGHQEVIKKALGMAEKVIVLVGSSRQARTIKNPFSFEERVSMILSDFKDFPDRVYVSSLRDIKYNDQAWCYNVQKTIETKVLSAFGWSDKAIKGGLIGHKKDETSYYLELFPQFELIEHEINEVVNATDIRDLYFNSGMLYLSGVVSESTYDFLLNFSKSSEYKRLVKENEFIKAYKKSWSVAPYPPTFLCSDAVVVQSGHLLLVRRKEEPGAGLLALPGGFVKTNERVVDGMIRELKEETRLKVPKPVLLGNIRGKELFDAPDRSLRGRTVTQAFFIELPAGPLPHVKARDDAKEAKWVLLSHIREEEMFEDHFSIIEHFLGNLD